MMLKYRLLRLSMILQLGVCTPPKFRLESDQLTRQLSTLLTLTHNHGRTKQMSASVTKDERYGKPGTSCEAQRRSGSLEPMEKRESRLSTGPQESRPRRSPVAGSPPRFCPVAGSRPLQSPVAGSLPQRSLLR